jgi:hypothetical protein
MFSSEFVVVDKWCAGSVKRRSLLETRVSTDWFSLQFRGQAKIG